VFTGVSGSGKSSLVFDTIAAESQRMIDMGPRGGHDGGRVIFEGPPVELVRAEGSLTGMHLERRLEAVAAG
jgi:excinuclease UvrABC ATPase subunit